MKFNINDNVKVRLNSAGFDIHRKYWAFYTGLSNYTPPKIDDQGYSTFQLWDLMVVFGPHVYLGSNKLPFETEIEL